MDAAAIRSAVLADLPSIRRLVEAAYARYADRLDRPPAPVLTDYRPAIDAGQVFVLGEPIAAVIVLLGSPGVLLVENVAVDPAAQGRGLGRRLMEFAEERASAQGASRVTLYANEVMTENLAIYAHLGYREVRRRAEGGYRRVFMEKRISEPPELC